jgi:hypothetical protein
MKHYYREQVKMDPKDGRTYSTTYIKQSVDQKKRTCDAIQRVHDKVFHARNTERVIRDWSDEPLKRSTRKEGNLAGTKYTRWDAIRDAHRQMNDLGHDMTVSISNRWNKALEDTNDQFEWELESQLAGVSTYHRLFEVKK